MRARQLIAGASFGPDALKAINQAFDSAWFAIAAHFGNDPEQIDIARYKLATALLTIANEESRDVEVLKKAALNQMALQYPQNTSAAYELKRQASKRPRPTTN
jgi:hypothetical protein